MQASLFAYPDGSPMLRSEFDVSLKRLLGFCGYQTSAFKGTEAAADFFFFFNVRELKLGGNDLCGSR